MAWHDTRIARLLLRPAGLLLLLVAFRVATSLVAIGRGHAGHEPALVYLLAAIAFICASAGAALLMNGHRLFENVVVAGRWVSHATPAIPRDDEES